MVTIGGTKTSCSGNKKDKIHISVVDSYIACEGLVFQTGGIAESVCLQAAQLNAPALTTGGTKISCSGKTVGQNSIELV